MFRFIFRSWIIFIGFWEVKCGEEFCFGVVWVLGCGRVSFGGVLGFEVVGINNGCFGVV